MLDLILLVVVKLLGHEEGNLNWQRTRDLIIHHEGVVVDAPYRDILGNWSFGVGRALSKNPPTFEETLALLRDKKEGAYLMLQNDLDACEAHAYQYPWFVELSDVRQAVVINMIFNLGSYGFAKFHRLHKALQYQNWTLAAAEILDSKAARQLPKRYSQLAEMVLHNRWPA